MTIDLLKSIIGAHIEKMREKSANPVSLVYPFDLLEEEGTKFVFIRKNLINLFIKYVQSKPQLEKNLPLKVSESYLQVIGDSCPFSKLGHRHSITVLQNLIENHAGSLLYGYTSTQHGGANGVVEDCLKNDPQLIDRVYANFVWRDSLTAVENWGCTRTYALTN